MNLDSLCNTVWVPEFVIRDGKKNLMVGFHKCNTNSPFFGLRTGNCILGMSMQLKHDTKSLTTILLIDSNLAFEFSTLLTFLKICYNKIELVLRFHHWLPSIPRHHAWYSWFGPNKNFNWFYGLTYFVIKSAICLFPITHCFCTLIGFLSKMFSIVFHCFILVNIYSYLPKKFGYVCLPAWFLN